MLAFGTYMCRPLQSIRLITSFSPRVPDHEATCRLLGDSRCNRSLRPLIPEAFPKLPYSGAVLPVLLSVRQRCKSGVVLAAEDASAPLVTSVPRVPGSPPNRIPE